MTVDRTNLFIVNTDITLKRYRVSNKVEEYDVVWFMDGLWRPLDGTLNNLSDLEFSWGVAYHVDKETSTSQIIYDGEIKGCPFVNDVGNWYVTANGKLTQEETNFYVGYSIDGASLILELKDLEFTCNSAIIYPHDEDWGNVESEDILTLELLSDVDFLKWGKENVEDTSGVLIDVEDPTRYVVTNDNFEELFFKISSTNDEEGLPETCSVFITSCMELNEDYKIEIINADGVVLDEEDTIDNLFVISPLIEINEQEEETVLNEAYFRITLLKDYEEATRNGTTLDIYLTDANLQKCTKQNSVFFLWLD